MPSKWFYRRDGKLVRKAPITIRTAWRGANNIRLKHLKRTVPAARALFKMFLCSFLPPSLPSVFLSLYLSLQALTHFSQTRSRWARQYLLNIFVDIKIVPRAGHRRIARTGRKSASAKIRSCNWIVITIKSATPHCCIKLILINPALHLPRQRRRKFVRCKNFADHRAIAPRKRGNVTRPHLHANLGHIRDLIADRTSN